MYKRALILHAWHNHPGDYWYPWLKSEMEAKGYVVEIPELPTMDTDLPDLAIQLATAEKYITPDTVVIGHSLGSLLAMRLAEIHEYSTMILIAGWDFNELTEEHRLFWKTPINHALIRKQVRNIYCVSSDNDPFITAITNDDMSKRLGGKAVLVPGAGHFTTKYGVATVPAILPLI